MIKSIFYISVFCFLQVNALPQKKVLGIEEKKINSATIQAMFSGKVVDAKSGEPLAGATILFPDLKIGTHADNSGRFQFAQVPAGHHLIEVSHIGYGSIIDHIDINSNIEK